MSRLTNIYHHNVTFIKLFMIVPCTSKTLGKPWAKLGQTMDEIGEDITLPTSLANEWALQGNYGQLGSAAQAVYLYLGWYNGNPATLQNLATRESASKYVAYMGGENEILRKAQKDFDDGNYRWFAEVLNRLIFANPDNKDAKELQAKTFEQLG